jgi:predicted RNA-binding Zn ribbon-like protein
VSPAQLADAHELREAIHRIVLATYRREPIAPPQAARRRTINRFAAGDVAAPQLVDDDELVWESSDPVAATFALIARDAIDLLTSPAIDRVRQCANPICGALFLAGPGPGAGSWCSRGACGER